MRDVLIDTNILVRLADISDPQYTLTHQSVISLRREGHRLCITPQLLVEFRIVATRPLLSNGLGLSNAQVNLMTVKIEATFKMLDESPAIYKAWKLLVDVGNVVGTQVHDARLVAVCQVYGISRILTFNIGHFKRLAQFVEGLEVVDPRMVFKVPNT